MSVKLRKRKLRGKNLKSQYKFYLDIYSNGQRTTETINHLILNENDTKEERKEIEKQAEQIARVKEQQLFNEEYGMPSKNNLKIDFITYFIRLMKEKEEVKTQEAWNNTLNYLKEYTKGAILFSKVNEEWLNGFIKYLQGKGLANNSIITYFNKITAALNQALREKKIFLNPAHNVQRLKKLETEKVNLTTEELQSIYNTPFYHEDVKRAFLFSCFTGLRVSDVMNLKWGNIKEKKKGNKKLTGINISQKKTKGFVYLPLNNVAVELMGKKKEEEQNVFYLPKHSKSVNKALKKLIKDAGIKKKVTFHCGRHTNAVQLITSGTDIYTVSKMLGHRDIKSTMVYAKVVDELKEKAVNSLPKIKMGIVKKK